MAKWMGIAGLVVAAFVLFCGWAVWSEMGEEGAALSAMRSVTAKELASAKVGERVFVEGKLVAQQPAVVEPVSREHVAWFLIKREHHWQEKRRTCRRFHCKDWWKNHNDPAGSESSKSIAVQIKGGGPVLHVPIPDEDHVIARLHMTDSKRTKMDIVPTAKHRKDYEVAKQYVLKLGTTITVAGAVTGNGKERTITRVKDTSLVYQVSRDAMLKDLRQYATTGIVTMLIAGLIALGSILLMIFKRPRVSDQPTAERQ